jgi:hypothetical protein
LELAVFGLAKKARGVEREIGGRWIDPAQRDGGGFVEIGAIRERQRFGTAQGALDQGAQEAIVVIHNPRSARMQARKGLKTPWLMAMLTALRE